VKLAQYFSINKLFSTLARAIRLNKLSVTGGSKVASVTLLWQRHHPHRYHHKLVFLPQDKNINAAFKPLEITSHLAEFSLDFNLINSTVTVLKRANINIHTGIQVPQKRNKPYFFGFIFFFVTNSYTS